MSKKRWMITVAAALAAATMVAGGLVWAAGVNAPPGPFPEYDRLPPPAPLPTPPPTVFPPDFWGPRSVPTPPGTGLSTAGTKVTFGSGSTTKTVQLPANVYVQRIVPPWSIVDCYHPPWCPRFPTFDLAVVGGKATITVAADLTLWIWGSDVAPGEEHVFDFLYEALGVARGSEIVPPRPGTSQ